MIEMNDLRAQYDVIGMDIHQAISNVIASGRYIGGPYVEAFEQEFSKFITGKHNNCTTCGNGTDALVIALKALGIGRGDEVIVPAFTFVATAEAVSLCGATPVFCDVGDSLLMVHPEDYMGGRTKAIIPVHLYGSPVNIDELHKGLGVPHYGPIHIVEDCAQGHGAKLNGVKCGAMGDIGCFSFFPGKNLGAYGDGGGIICKDEDLLEEMRMYKDHGRKEKYNHEFIGTNSRLDAIQAGILLVKLEALTKENEHRKTIAKFYRNRIGEMATVVNSDDSVYHQFVVRLCGNNRERVMEHLKANGISCAVHYPTPIPFTGGYAKFHKKGEFPVAEKAAKEVLSLPIHGYMDMSAAETVMNKFIEALNK
jgi:dTDP-4-amino-4,6-dideoxygalactose transaminase